MRHSTLSACVGNIHGETYENINERSQEAGKLFGFHQGHETVLRQCGTLPNIYAEVAWWHGETGHETLHDRTLQRQRLGIMQSEQKEYKLWTYIFELMFDPQSLKVANIHFFVINGS